MAQKIPIAFYYGDYIDNGDPKINATKMWQKMREGSYEFTKAYNVLGGKSVVVDLPKEGITGNDHFIFQDLNNGIVADHIEKWLEKNAK